MARVNENLWVLVSEAEVYGDLYIGSIFKGIGDNTLEYTAGPVKTTENGVTSAEIDAYTDEELAEKLAEIERDSPSPGDTVWWATLPILWKAI